MRGVNDQAGLRLADQGVDMRRAMIGCTVLSMTFWTMGVAGSGAAAPAGFAASAGGSSVRADFDGDGFADLAVGVPGEDRERGAVNVIYGSARGLTAVDQYWTQGTPGIKSAGGWSFGFALAAANFGKSAHADLAVGLESAAGGAVNVLYGSLYGLTAAGGQYWTPDTPGIKGKAEGSDRFGSAFAAGGPG